jgi:hypothetical protein
MSQVRWFTPRRTALCHSSPLSRISALTVSHEHDFNHLNQPCIDLSSRTFRPSQINLHLPTDPI